MLMIDLTDGFQIFYKSERILMNQETTIDSNKLGTQSSQNPSLQSSFISFIDEQLDEHLQQKSQQYQIDFRNDTPFMIKDVKEGYIMQNINKTIQPLETIDSVQKIGLNKSLRQQNFDMSRDSAILNSQISFLQLNEKESMHKQRLKLIDLKERDPIGSEVPLNIEKLSIYQSQYLNLEQANAQLSMRTKNKLNQVYDSDSLKEFTGANQEIRKNIEFETPNKRKLGQKLTHKQVLNQSSPDQKAILKQLKRQNMNLTFGMKSRIALVQQTSNKISKILSPNKIPANYMKDEFVQDKQSYQNSSFNQVESNSPSSKNIKAKEDNIFPKETEEISKSFGIPQIHPQH
eukprot:403372116